MRSRQPHPNNWALRLRTRTDAYYQRKEHLYYEHLAVALTALKRQRRSPGCKRCQVSPCSRALRHLESAFRNFFEGRAKYPTFKKKRGRQSATYASSAFKWDGNALTLAKMDAPLDIRWSRPLPQDAKPITITVTKDPAGRYFVSFLVEEDFKPLPISPQMVGIDLGLHDVVTLSTGEKTGNEHFFTKDEKAPGHAPASPRQETERRARIERKPDATSRAFMPALPIDAVTSCIS